MKKHKFKKIYITLVFCSMILFMMGTGITANAWNASSAFTQNISVQNLQSSMKQISEPTFLYNNDDLAYGASDYETLASYQLITHSVEEIEGLYFVTAKLSPLLAYGLENGAIDLKAVAGARFENKNYVSYSTMKIRSFISSGEIVGSGLSQNSFMSNDVVTGNTISKTLKNSYSYCTSNAIISESEGEYIRFGASFYTKSDKYLWSTAKAYITSIYIQLYVIRNDYNVTYDMNYPDSESVDLTATYAMDMPNNLTVSRPGYTFDGFYEGATVPGKQYLDSSLTSQSVWDKTHDDTLYANWYQEGLSFSFNSSLGGYLVSQGTNTDSKVVLPVAYNGYPVVGVLNGGFQNNTYINELHIIGDNVSIIGDYAFMGCSNLSLIYADATDINNIAVPSNNIFDNCDSNLAICVTNGYDNIYKQKWSSYSSIIYNSSIITFDLRHFSEADYIEPLIYPIGWDISDKDPEFEAEGFTRWSCVPGEEFIFDIMPAYNCNIIAHIVLA